MSICNEKLLRSAMVNTILHDSRSERGESSNFFGLQDLAPGISATSATGFDPGNYETDIPIILLIDAITKDFRRDFESFLMEVNVVFPYNLDSELEDVQFTLYKVLSRFKSLFSGTFMSKWTGAGFLNEDYPTDVEIEGAGELDRTENYIISTLFVKTIFPKSLRTLLRR